MKSIPPLQDLRAALKSPRWRERFDAVDALREMGPQIPGVIEAIMQATGDEDHSVRRLARHSLSYFGRVHDPEVKAAIISNLEKLKQKYRSAISIPPVTDDPSRLPTESELQSWEKEISDGEPFFLTAEESLDYVQEDLDRNGCNAEVEFQEAAERSEKELRPALKPVVERLVESFKKGKYADCLQEIKSAQVDINELRKILVILFWNGKDQSRGSEFGIFIHSWLAESPERLTLLVELLEYRDSGIAYCLFKTFEAIDNRGVPYLTQGLHHPAPLVRERAADILGLLGQEAKEAEGELRSLLKDPYTFVRQSAAFALLSVGTSMGIPFHRLFDFEYHLTYTDPIDRVVSENAGEMRAMVPALREIAKNQVKEYRELAVKILRKLVESQ